MVTISYIHLVELALATQVGYKQGGSSFSSRGGGAHVHMGRGDAPITRYVMHEH